MESILPTEIARLVYGYLIEENCENVAQSFLETSLHLKECLMVKKKGRKFNTTVSGYNLVDILDRLCEVTCIVKDYIEKHTGHDTENDLIKQLQTLLIPSEVKKVSFRKASVLRNPENAHDSQENCLLLNQDSQPNFYEECAPSEDVRNENLFDSLCHPCNNISQTQEDCSPDLNSKKIESVCGSNVQDGVKQDNVLQLLNSSSCDTDIQSTLGKKESCCNDIPKKEDVSINKHVLNVTENIDDSLRDHQLTSCSTSKAPNTINVEETNTNCIDLINSPIPSTKISSSLNMGCPQINSLSNPSVPDSEIVKQITNQNPLHPVSGIQLQLNTSPKIQLSLLNQPVTNLIENNYLGNVNRPCETAYNFMNTFTEAPTILIEPQIKQHQSIKSIFTADNRPVVEENLPILKPKSTKESDTEIPQLKNLPSVSPESNQNKNDKQLSNIPLIKRSGVRTRGGCVKRFGKSPRRVKAHLPNKLSVQEDINDFGIGNERSSDEQHNTAISCDQQDIDKESGHLCNQENLFDENNLTGTIPSCSSILSSKDNSEKQNNSGTLEKSENTTMKVLRKRISLSVPRRGSHVRALDFKTPTKNGMNTRRAITSPKQIHCARSPLKKSLRSVRGALFKSPTTNKNEKEKAKAWDSDLRKYAAETADIPTSVGLKRKTNPTNNSKSNLQRIVNKNSCKNTKTNKKTSCKSGSKTPVKKIEESNDDLADKIEKEVLSVIGEETINLIGENTNLISDSELEKIMNKNERPDEVKVSIDSNCKDSSEKQNISVGQAKKSSSQNSTYNSDLNNILLKKPLQKMEDKLSDESSLMATLSKPIKKNEKSLENSAEQALAMTPVSKALREHREILQNLVNHKSLMTPISKAIEERREMFENEGQESLLTPVSKAIQERREMFENVGQESLMTPVSKAIQEHRELIENVIDQASLMTPVGKAIQEHREVLENVDQSSLMTPVSKTIQEYKEMIENVVDRTSLMTPLSKGIQEHRNITENMDQASLMTPISKAIQDHRETHENVIDQASLMTPVSKVIQEHNELLNQKLLTPGTPIQSENLNVENESTNIDVPLMKISSPFCTTNQDSLEASLIKECSRIERDNLKINAKQERDVYKEISSKLEETPEKIIIEDDKQNKLNRSENISPIKQSLNNSPCKNQLDLHCAEDIPSTSNKNKNVTEKSPQQNVLHPNSNKRHFRIIPNNNENEYVTHINTKQSKKPFNHSSNVSNFRHKSNLNCKNNEFKSNIDKISPNSNISSPNKKKNSFSVGNVDETLNEANNEELKVKNKKFIRNTEIDCSKLIAQCLQSAKENLYGGLEAEKKLATVGSGMKNAKKDHSSSPKDKKLLNSINRISKKFGYNSKNDFTKEQPNNRSRIKNINQLLSESSSSSSEDSDMSKDNNSSSDHNESDRDDNIRQLSVKSSKNQALADKLSPESCIKKAYNTRGFKRQLALENNTKLLDEIQSKRTILKKNVESNLLPTIKSPNQQSKDTPTSPENISPLEKKSVKTENKSPKPSTSAERKGSPRINLKRNTDLEIKRTEPTKQIYAESVKNDIYINDFDKNKQKLTPSLQSVNITKNNLEIHQTDKGENIPVDLNNFVYDFTLTVDGSNVTKQLRVSPFLNIFEMENLSETIGKQSEKKHDKDTHCRNSSEERSRKRKYENDKEKIEWNAKRDRSKDRMPCPKKIHKRDNDFNYRGSHSFRGRNHRFDEPRGNRDSRNGVRNFKREINYGRNYRSYTPLRFRRHPSISRRLSRAVNKPGGEKPNRNLESSKWKNHRSKEEAELESSSHRSHKTSSNSKHTDEFKKKKETTVRNQYKSDSGNSRNTYDHSERPVKIKKEHKTQFDKEDGELTESSMSAYSIVSSSLNKLINNQRLDTKQCTTPPVDEETRAKLKKLNLDDFLSLLHGSEK